MENLTWDDLANIYDKEVGGRRARMLPMGQVFDWAAKQVDKFTVHKDGTISKKGEVKKMNRSFYVAGVQFRPKHEIAAAMKEVKEGDRLGLVAEPDNKYDPNAVQIKCNIEDPKDGGSFIPIFLGYVPKKFSSEVSALLEAGVDLDCIVEAANPAAKPWEMLKVVIKEKEEPEDGE
uniref:Putative HIRAN domain containing protein n=1 Tax=viral metagenome TaxID=1070528 RepID=A0A6M3LTV3_9ZZZZ